LKVIAGGARHAPISGIFLSEIVCRQARPAINFQAFVIPAQAGIHEHFLG
jgi:hypothetical protein